MKHLNHLDLSFNQISTINEGDFGQVHIASLNLDDNEIKYIHPYSFKGVFYLSNLGNYISLSGKNLNSICFLGEVPNGFSIYIYELDVDCDNCDLYSFIESFHKDSYANLGRCYPVMDPGYIIDVLKCKVKPNKTPSDSELCRNEFMKISTNNCDRNKPGAHWFGLYWLVLVVNVGQQLALGVQYIIGHMETLSKLY
jgi:hypothetical protein